VVSVVDAPPAASLDATAQFPVPAYVPGVVQPVLRWTRRHVAHVAARYRASLANLWDEALTGLLRASIHWQPAVGAFGPYARTAVHRACWRYVIRGQATQVRTVPLELEVAGLPESHRWQERAVLPAALIAPSAEDEAIACEAARRAFLLRLHATLAAARGTDDTAGRLRAAASAADRVARTRRASPPSSRSA